jgi:hypothetical protein
MYLKRNNIKTSEKLVNFYETTRRNIPEDSLHTRRRENLKDQTVRAMQSPKKAYEKCVHRKLEYSFPLLSGKKSTNRLSFSPLFLS